MSTPWGALLQVGGNLIDELFTSDEERAQAKLKLQELQQSGRLKEQETKLSAIIAEANSKDPYTSRARPSFLYVVYVLILSAIPMGVLSAFAPEIADRIIDGFEKWLGAIPKEMLTLFGTVMLGYTVTRGYEKVKGVSK